MNAGRDTDPMPLHELEQSASTDDALEPIGPPPTLADLSTDASSRIVRYIVTVTLEPGLFDLGDEAQRRIRRFAIEERLEHGLAPVELIDLYRTFDLAGDLRAQQYLDRVYVERMPPSDWVDLQSEAGRIVDLAEARG